MSLFALNMTALSMIALTYVFAPFNVQPIELPPMPETDLQLGHLEPVQPIPVERPDQPEIVLDMQALNESILSDALTTITNL
ncbi:hypothetical protein HBI98_01215 [Aeromonas veronii]|nr:hypothetical protein [Aeromonas veronii]